MRTAGELKYCKSSGVFNKIFIPLALIGYEIVVANCLSYTNVVKPADADWRGVDKSVVTWYDADRNVLIVTQYLMQISIYSSRYIDHVYPITFSDTLFKDDVSRLVENYGENSLAFALYLKYYLIETYPTEYWVVTVYDDVTGFDKHAYLGIRTGAKFRHNGANYVVTRFPKYIARSPSVPISEVVGSVSGSDAKTIRDSIKDKFDTRGQGYSFIHVVKRTRETGWWLDKRKVVTYIATSLYMPKNNIFWKHFPDATVIVVAPRY